MKRLISLALLTAVVGLSLTASASAAPPTPVTCGSTITAPGQYFLVADCTGPGIDIRANDVHLLLNGHTMDGAGVADNGIHALNASGVDIQGPGNVVGYGGRGLLFEYVNRSRIEKVTAARNVLDGIVLQASNQNRLEGNTFTENGTHGIGLGLSSNNVFVNNSSSQNRSEGVHLVGPGSLNNNFVRNTLNSNRDGGFQIDQGANGNDIDGNTVTGTIGNGISINSTGNYIHGNTAFGNAPFDLHDSNPSCDANKWDGNRFGTASQPCIS